MTNWPEKSLNPVAKEVEDVLSALSSVVFSLLLACRVVRHPHRHSFLDALIVSCVVLMSDRDLLQLGMHLCG